MASSVVTKGLLDDLDETGCLRQHHSKYDDSYANDYDSQRNPAVPIKW